MSEVLVLISGILNTVNYIRPGQDVKLSGQLSIHHLRGHVVCLQLIERSHM